MPAIAYVLCLLGCLQLPVIDADTSELLAAPHSPRLMQFLREPQPQLPSPPNFSANRRSGGVQLPRVRPNGDNLHPPGPWRSPLPPPVLAGQQLMRREFNGNWAYSGGARFAHSKDSTPVLDVGKNQFYRPKDVAQQNFNGNQYTPNFKASPHFNVNSAVKHEPNKFPGYSPVKQYAIPVEANKYVAGYADHTPSQHSPLASAGNSYAVYEESELATKNAAPFGGHSAYQQIPSKLSKEAENYLHFMSTNDYFLPKRDPNYKQQDVERDQISYQQQRLVQQQQQNHKQQQLQLQQQYQQYQQLQQQQQQQQQKPQQPQQPLIDSSVSSSFNKPLRVSDLFYQQDPAPPNSAVVRGSYQAGKNAFVVKSDGNKSVKHILSTSLTPRTTQAPAASTAYSYSWHSGHKTETPEPVRFEFTENDAIRGSASYTNSPQGQKYFYETHTPTPHTPAVNVAPAPASPQPVKELVADAKESTEYANKHAAEPESAPSPIPTVESPKDNEAYCEKICANVYDENDEIVCGSDGYMYTGETQLQCYSSCLNIEVSIKSKGSCS